MAREYFKNLPNTTTPLEASRLNGFLNGEESIEKLVVGNIECKNLFDKNNANIFNGYINGTKTYLSSTTRTLYIKCNPNTTYTIQKRNDGNANVFYVGTTATIPTVADTPTIDFVSNASGNKITITTSSNATYLSVYYYRTSETTLTEAEILDSIQIEEGSTATDYVPFKKYGYNSIDSMGEIVVDDIICKNLFTGLVKGVALNSTTGAETLSENSATSDYIPVTIDSTHSMILNGLTAALTSTVSAYNSNKEFLGMTGTFRSVSRTLDTNSFNSGTPQGTGDIAYLRVRQYQITTDTGTIDDVDGLTIQLEYGDTATPYAEHKEFNSRVYSLWRNLAPASEFAGQQVSLSDDIRNYKYYEVIYKVSTSNNNTFSTGKIPTSSTTYLLMTLNYIYRRSITSIGSNGKTLVFADGGRYETYGSSTLTTMNNYTIPLEVLAYK